MPVAINDIVRITAVVSMFGQEFVNVHFFKTIANGSVDDTAFMAAVQSMLAAVYANVQNDQSDEVRYERIEGQNITQDQLLPQTNWVGNPTGNKIEDPLPLQTSMNVFWPTLRPRTRCTSYLPGMTEAANNTEGEWGAVAIANAQQYGDDLVGNITFGGVTILKGAYNVALDRFTDLVNAVVPLDARTQRRRRRGVGS